MHCPECGSSKIVHEGVDVNNGADVYECQDCLFDWEEANER